MAAGEVNTAHLTAGRRHYGLASLFPSRQMTGNHRHVSTRRGVTRGHQLGADWRLPAHTTNLVTTGEAEGLQPHLAGTTRLVTERPTPVTTVQGEGTLLSALVQVRVLVTLQHHLVTTVQPPAHSHLTRPAVLVAEAGTGVVSTAQPRTSPAGLRTPRLVVEVSVTGQETEVATVQQVLTRDRAEDTGGVLTTGELCCVAT